MALRIVACVVERASVDVETVEEARTKIMEFFKEDYDHDAPNIEYATAYYCLADAENGECRCRLLR